MSDYFSPPAEADHRVKTPLCRDRNDEGDRCDLYRGHFGDHKDKSRRKSWRAVRPSDAPGRQDG